MTIIFKKFNFLCKLVAGCPLWLYSSMFSVTSQTKRNLRFSVSRFSLIPRPNEEICWRLSNSKPCTKCFCNCRAVALKKQFPSVFMGSTLRSYPERFLVMLSSCCVVKLNSMLFKIDSCSKRLAYGTFLYHRRSIKSSVLFLHFVVKQLINSCKCNTLSVFSQFFFVAEPKIDRSQIDKS